MSEALPGLLVALPVAGAAAVAILPRHRVVVSILATAAVLAAGIWSLVLTADGERIVLGVGGLDASIGIVLVVDPLAAIATVVSVAVVLATQVALTGTSVDSWPLTRPALLLVTAGVVLSFVTGDLFTLFVSFEIVLLGSYVLLTRNGHRQGVRAAPAYVGANIVGSGIFILAIATVYGATGEVNMAAVAAAWGDVDPALRAIAGGGLLTVFALKAALVPWGVWLPRTYGALPPVLGAAVAALLTKVGVAALLRVSGLLGLTVPGTAARTVLLTVACVTMVGGVVVALGQQQVHRILAAHVVSQVGFMVAGIAILDVVGSAAGVLYLAHHVLVKGALLLVAAAVLARVGSLALGDLRGLARSSPWLVALFVLGGATLAGLPPTSGFVAKLALLQAGIANDLWWVVASMGVASVLTLVSMVKIHTAMQAADETADSAGLRSPPVGGTTALRTAGAGAAALLGAGVALAVFAGPVADLTVVAADTALDVDGYVAEVLGAEEGS